MYILTNSASLVLVSLVRCCCYSHAMPEAHHVGTEHFFKAKNEGLSRGWWVPGQWDLAGRRTGARFKKGRFQWDFRRLDSNKEPVRGVVPPASTTTELSKFTSLPWPQLMTLEAEYLTECRQQGCWLVGCQIGTWLSVNLIAGSRPHLASGTLCQGLDEIWQLTKINK